MAEHVKKGLAIVAMILAVFQTPAIAAPPPLTTAAAVRSLTFDQAAQRVPVLVTGVVTVAESSWSGKFFMQDSTGGIWVNNHHDPQPALGDLIQVSGLSHQGGYTPDIISPHLKKLGTAPLPEARPVSTARFLSGAEDGNRVEVSGVVQSAKPAGTGLEVAVESGDQFFLAFTPAPSGLDPAALVGTTVHLRGTAAASFDAKERRLLSVALFVPQISDFMDDQRPLTAENSFAAQSADVAITNVITTAAGVLSLKPEQADKQIPVELTGVVTVSISGWGGKFFLQDATGGIFVNDTRKPPDPGDRVAVSGFTHLGGYAPDVNSRHWTPLGTAPLPEPKKVSVDQLMSGAEDGERIEISCVLRSVLLWSDNRLGLDLVSGGFAFKAFAPPFTNINPKLLIGATVRIRGTAAAAFNQFLRQRVSVVIFMARESDFIVHRVPDTAVATLPCLSLNAIAQYRRADSPDARVRVRGVVTYQRPCADIFLHDSTGGLEIENDDTNLFAPGEIVEAVGFPALKNYLPVLENAVLIRGEGRAETVVPDKVPISELMKGFHNSDLISLQGKLLYRSRQQIRTDDPADSTPDENILTLQNGGHIFTVEAPGTPEYASLASIPIGSTLQVSGICVLKTDEAGRITGVQILVRDLADVHVVRLPDWWTPQHLLLGLGVLLVISFVGAVWTMTILRKNAALKISVAEKACAQAALQKANDMLETRVQERTKQLKVEISARKEAEVKFDATIAERTRIAQELHDTLLQGFTGIGLKLEVITNGLPDSLAADKMKLKKILEQSDDYVDEARQAVWELRSPFFENNGDFSQTVMKVSERALLGTDIRLQFMAHGEAFKPAPAVEDNLLRICEEAVTNAVKHACPTRVEVKLEYTPAELRLLVRDDGCGFHPNGADASKDGHFGILGIRERTQSIHGIMSLRSHPGQGTEILVTISRTV